MIDRMKTTISTLETALAEAQTKLKEVHAAQADPKLSPEQAMDLSVKETALLSDISAMRTQIETWQKRLATAVEAETKAIKARLKELKP